VDRGPLALERVHRPQQPIRLARQQDQDEHAVPAIRMPPLDAFRACDMRGLMVEARIRQRMKSAMQSGRHKESAWLLEYEPAEAKRPDPLTGWAGSGDTRDQVRLAFPTLEAAKAYAERNGLSYHVTLGQEGRTLKLQAYADNFKGPAI
jgi:hypothetical protein